MRFTLVIYQESINLRGSERKMSAITSVKVNTWNPPPSTHTNECWKQQL